MSSSPANASSWTAAIPDSIDAFGRLFELVWVKSPCLAYFVIIAALLYPFARLYASAKMKAAELAADTKVKQARTKAKKEGKANA